MQRKPLFERVEEGFQAAIAYAEGKRSLRKSWVPVIAPPSSRSAQEIIELRQTLGLNQQTMAKILSVSTSTLAAWEKWQRKPSGSALRLLQMLEKVDSATLWLILNPDAPSSTKAPCRQLRASP